MSNTKHIIKNLDKVYQDLVDILNQGLVKEIELKRILTMIDGLQNAIEELEINKGD